MNEITCPNCQQVNSDTHSFCTRCGFRLANVNAPDEEVPAAGEEQQTLRAELAQARSELREAGALLQRLGDRISQLESNAGLSAQATEPSPDVPQRAPTPVQRPTPPQPTPPRAAAPSAPSQAPTSGFSRAQPVADRPLSDTGAVPPSAWPDTPAPRYSRPSIATIDWEQVLGRNWIAIIGAVALVVGIGFFLKLAFDNNWIGDTGRVGLGVGVGLALLGAGEYTSRRVPRWSQPVTAAGAAILYLTIYASYGLYELLQPEWAFLSLAVVVALAGLLALRYESVVIAVLGIVGAFLSPLLLGTSLPDVRLVLVYILLVDLGILGVSTFRNWRWFTLLGWVGSYGLFAYWLNEFPDYEPLLAQGALTGVFLVFAGATTLFHLIWKRVPGPLDMALVAANAAGFFGLTFAILWDDYETWFGLIGLGLATFHGLMAYASVKRSGGASDMALMALPVAMVFLTVSAPLQFSDYWLTVAWAGEGVALVGAGFLLGRWHVRTFGLGVLALAVGNLLLFDAWLDLESFRLLLNERVPVFAAVVAALYVAGAIHWWARGHWRARGRATEEWEQYATPSLLVIANVLTLTLLSMEVINYFDYRVKWASDFLDSQTATNGKYLALTIMFALYGFAVTAVGLAFRVQLARWAGLGLMAVAVVKLLLVDTFLVKLDPRTFVVFLNYHFLAVVVVVAALLALAYWFRRERSRLPEWENYVFTGLVVALNVVVVWALSQEIVHYFDSREVALGGDYLSAKHLSLTVLWAVYAIGVIAAGIALRSSKVRLAGMMLLGIPVIKLFVFDVFLLEQGYRVAAFVTLGALLLGTGLVYQRYSIAIRGFFFGEGTTALGTTQEDDESDSRSEPENPLPDAEKP